MILLMLVRHLEKFSTEENIEMLFIKKTDNSSELLSYSSTQVITDNCLLKEACLSGMQENTFSMSNT